jgi:cytochrome c-type biogenesis protein CcmH
MTAFFIAGGLLLAAILALLLTPLLRRSQHAASGGTAELSLRVLREHLAELAQERAAARLDTAAFERERTELERRAIEDGAVADRNAAADRRRPWLAVAVALAVPLAAAGLYWQLGNPAAMTGAPTKDSHALTPQQIQTMAMQLAERLQDNPQDGQGWLMLARSYSVLRRYPESAAAFGRATSLLPADAGLLADYADTLAMAQGRRLTGEPENLIARALQVDPKHIKALALQGSVAFERQDFARAIADWEKVLALVPADSGVAKGMRNSIADARTRLGSGSAAPPPIAAGDGLAGPSVAGVISLDLSEQEQSSLSPTDTLFVFARAVDGPRMPLAMQRLSGAQLPVRFRLDDAMAMSPVAKLSAYKWVIVGARISRSGDALPKPGDWEGFSEPVAVGSENVRIVIGTPVR